MEEQEFLQKNEISGLTIRDLFYKYIRFLPLIILSVALSLFVAYIYLRYATPIYESAGSMIIKDDQPLKGSDKFDQALANEYSKNIQNEIEVLKSRPLMMRVVNKMNLNFTYYAKGKVKELNIYGSCPFSVEAFHINDSSVEFNLLIHFVSDINFTVNGEKVLFSFGQVFQNQNGIFRLIRKAGSLSENYRVSWTPTFPLATSLVSNLSVVPKAQGTEILNLTLDTDNPQFTADVINEVMDEYQDLTLEEKNASNLRSKAFIDGQIKVVSHELDSFKRRLVSYMQANNILNAEVQGSSYFNKISDADKGINQQRAQLEVAEIIESYLTDKRNAFDPVPSSLGLQDITLNGMTTAYNMAQLEHKTLVDGNVPKTNIMVRQLEEKIEKLRENILESLKNVKSSFAVSIQMYENQSNIAQSEARVLPKKQQVLEDIKIEEARKLNLYNYLMEKNEEIGIAMASKVNSSKILDEAFPSYSPVKPKKNNIRLMAVAMGLIIPGLFIFLLEVLNDKISTRLDVERGTPTPVIGEVGHSYGEHTLMVTPNNRGIIAEQFRIVRSNLQFILTHISKPIILVTSSFSGEGKSFVSTNMGAVMALTGKKTVILEFDIRKPKILSQLHISRKPGLTNFILGKIKAEELPVPIPGSDNLFVLPCGPVPPNPAELLLDTRVGELFSYLKENFDVIIMDTAPVGMVSDAMTLGKYADCTLYIVRQGYTFKKQIGLIDEFYKKSKLPKISIILNDVKVRTGYGYYGYGRYGYGYGYGSGYFEEETLPPSFLERWFGWLDINHWKKKLKKAKRI